MDHIYRATKETDEGTLVLEIWRDEDAESPREWDNCTAIWAKNTHRNYNFHEEASESVLARIMGRMPIPDDIADAMEETGDERPVLMWLYKNHTPASSYGIQPVFMYDHGGLRFSTTPYSDGWDSGQLGWIITDVTLWSELNGSGWDTARVDTCLIKDIEIMDDFHAYGAYGFMAYREKSCACCGQSTKEEDACVGGFFGPLRNKVMVEGVLTEVGVQSDMQSHMPEKYRDLLNDWR